MSFTITVDDPRGECWRYSDSERDIQIGIGGLDGLSVQTDDLIVKTGPKLDMRSRMIVLANFMRYMAGPRDGTAKLNLYVVKPYRPSAAQLEELDAEVSEDGFKLTQGTLDGKAELLVWQRDVGPRK